MNDAFQSLRGMNDILPPVSVRRSALLQEIRRLLHGFAYRPIELPLLEKTGLFQRSIGGESDIVSKEMYTFLDRNEESITLRPEATAGVVRAVIENGLLQQVSRFYAEGPMFRYEKPQEGRSRQFTQVSVECFGIETPALDAELIQIGDALFKRLGIREALRLEINSIGLSKERKRYQSDLVDYLQGHYERLDEDSKRRLTTNPLRILDSKNEEVQSCLQDAPKLKDYLGEESQAHFAKLKSLLEDLGIEYVENPRLVRGLDYYCHSVFEWTTTALGAQGTVCGGGRYDGLVEILGGKPTPAAGFAFGVDRILMLCDKLQPLPDRGVDIYVLAHSAAEQGRAMQWAQALREAFPDLSILCHNQFQSLKKQLRKADTCGAHYALIFGSEELALDKAILKDLRLGKQDLFSLQELFDFFASLER